MRAHLAAVGNKGHLIAGFGGLLADHQKGMHQIIPFPVELQAPVVDDFAHLVHHHPFHFRRVIQLNQARVELAHQFGHGRPDAARVVADQHFSIDKPQHMYEIDCMKANQKHLNARIIIIP